MMVQKMYIPTLKEVASFGERVQYFRESRGITLIELAKKTGFSKSKLSRIENLESEKPTFYTLLTFSEALGISVENLRGTSAESQRDYWVKYVSTDVKYINEFLSECRTLETYSNLTKLEHLETKTHYILSDGLIKGLDFALYKVGYCDEILTKPVELQKENSNTKYKKITLVLHEDAIEKLMIEQLKYSDGGMRESLSDMAEVNLGFYAGDHNHEYYREWAENK